MLFVLVDVHVLQLFVATVFEATICHRFITLVAGQHAAIKQKIKYRRMVEVHPIIEGDYTQYTLPLFACAQACTAVTLLRTQLPVKHSTL
jgi:hypothetical protein